MNFSPTSRPQHAIHEPQPAGENPAVLNVRRPQPIQADAATLPTHSRIDGNGLDDAPLPPTALRLPDLAAVTKPFTQFRFKRRTGEALQWVGIGLGGLLALWLIFGGRGGPALDTSNAPAPDAAGPAAATWTPPAPDAPEAPRWEAPQWQGPAEGAEPDVPVNPANQIPNRGDSSSPAPPAAGEEACHMPPNGGPAARTAQRPPSTNAQPGPGTSPGETHSLGITVPVPQ